MTAWTPPRSWAAGNTITAADLNTYLRDNLKHLKENAPAVGTIDAYAGASAPTGYLLCDGSAVSRTTYADLFAAIGTTYGAGNGTTTFNLPDLRGRFPLGVSGSHALGSTGGSETKTLIEANLPAHTHTMTQHTHEVGYIDASLQAGSGLTAQKVNTGAGGSTVNTDLGSASPTGVTGQGTAFDVMNPFIALNFIIKY